MSEDFSDWIDRCEQVVDVLEPARTNALRAALGLAEPLATGAPLPLLHHWLYFWDVRPPKGLGSDGHPARGGFLPPITLPRRMWAGGRLNFVQPLLVGERVARASTILKVESKSGRSGDLVFVTVEHRLTGENGVAIIEEQDIVYRGATAPGAVAGPAGEGPAPSAPWARQVVPDTVLLFRYSALTMNAHRIHYDRPYAMDEEAYPGLVVQGPLQATLLADLGAGKLKGPIIGFEFRGLAPAIDGTLLHVCGEPTETGARVWTEQAGVKSMTATITCGAAT
jgi:3-methylfumaryl-CoA hydratase